jgi:esterase/lipase superfamily enzyme
MSKQHLALAVCILLVLPAAIGCNRRILMPTPNLYLGQGDGEDPFADVPPKLRNNKVDVLYVTDRAPITPKNGSVRYGHRRSNSMAFGSCTVEIGKDVEWSVLVKNSRTKHRSVSLPLKVTQTTEHARFPATPLTVVSVGNVIELDPKEVKQEAETAAGLQDDITRRLKLTKRKEAFVYIHGFNNTFEDSVFVSAELWHFMGHSGIPIVYSWPSKKSIWGYGYDRESSEFTVFHFKQFLRAIAKCKDLKKIHILAHSRGTGVAASAFRELVIASKAWPGQNAGTSDSPGQEARKVLSKVGNVILAAADIDMEVASQRLSAEMAFMGAERVTIYLSREDKAINFAVWLFESIGRLGELSLRIISPDHMQALEIIDRIDFVDARVDTGFMGHGYFHSSPAVSSDLILLLRDNLSPGDGRPLACDERSSRYWSIEKDYPYTSDE